MTTPGPIVLQNYGLTVFNSGQNALDAHLEPPNPSTTTTVINTFTGGENPSWKKQVKNGTNATTNASGFEVERTGTPARYFVKGYVNGNTAIANARSTHIEMFNLSVLGSAATNAQVASVVNQAKTKFSKSVERAMTQFSGGVFLAELRETLHMIRRPAQSLRKGIGQYLATVQKNARKLKRQPKPARERWVSNTWLEYSFGWIPALNDLDDARSYLQRRHDVLLQELVPVKGSYSGRFLNNEVQRGYGGGSGSLLVRERRVDVVTQVYSGAVSSRAYGPGLINASAMGLHPRSFVPTLWEVIPWSFVVDYFTNVGDVITGWSNQHTRLAWGRSTFIEQREADFIDQHGAAAGFTKILEETLIPSNQRLKVKSFTRVPILSPPVPGLSFEIPGFGTKWVNLAALAAARRSISSSRLGQ